MAHETAPENARTLELLDIQPADHVLEVGFGPGRAIARAVTLAHQGHVSGFEVSDQMLEMASGHNENAVREGRVDLQRADGPDLPYRDASFDRAYSVHTLYFWRDAAPRLREIHRVLKPAGRFVLTFRYGEGVVANFPAAIYTHRRPDEVVSLLQKAGFLAVLVHEDPPLYFAVADRTG